MCDLDDCLQEVEPLRLLHQLVEGFLRGAAAGGQAAGRHRLHQLLEAGADPAGLGVLHRHEVHLEVGVRHLDALHLDQSEVSTSHGLHQSQLTWALSPNT